MRRSVAAVVGLLLVVTVGWLGFELVRDGDDVTATAADRTLTVDEANRLAVTRFRNHQRGTRSVLMRMPTPSGELTLDGVVDFGDHLGYGLLSGGGSDSVSLVQWTLGSVIVRPWVVGEPRPSRPPADGWQGRSLRPVGATLDISLLLVLNLAGDRPENAQLLSQNGARWLRSDTVGDLEVDVLAGPGAAGEDGPSASRTRFWLTGDGTMLRAEVDVESADAPVEIELGDAEGRVRVVPGLLSR